MRELVRYKIFLASVSVFLLSAWCLEDSRSLGADDAALADLIDQVEGNSCKYMADHTLTEQDRRCKRRPFYYLPFFSGAPSRYVCVKWAAECLGHMGKDARSAVPALLKALREGPNDYDTGDGTIATRSTVARALGKIGDPSAIPGLIDALERAQPYDLGSGASEHGNPIAARGAIAEALGSFGPDGSAAIPALMRMLRNGMARGDGDTALAAWALGRIEATEAIPLLIELLSCSDKGATHAAEALGRLGPASKGAVHSLSQVLLSENRNRVTRRQAAIALGRIGETESIFVLAQALKDSRVTQAAAEALARFGSKAAPVAPDLITLLKKPSGAAIDPNSGATHYTDESGSLHSARVIVIDLLAKIGTPEAFQALVDVLPDPELANTTVVINALIRMDPQGAKLKPVFLTLTRKQEPLVKWVGVRGLGKLKDLDLTPDLIVALGDSDCRVRKAAIRALCARANMAADALPALNEMALSQDGCGSGLVNDAIRKITAAKQGGL